jgi:hypothetical protein
MTTIWATGGRMFPTAVTGIAVCGIAAVGFMVPLLFTLKRHTKAICSYMAAASAILCLGWAAWLVEAGPFTRLSGFQIIAGRYWFLAAAYPIASMAYSHYYLTGHRNSNITAFGILLAVLLWIGSLYQNANNQRWFFNTSGLLIYYIMIMFAGVQTRHRDWAPAFIAFFPIVLPAMPIIVYYLGYEMAGFNVAICLRYLEYIFYLLTDVAILVGGVIIAIINVAPEEWDAENAGAAGTPQEAKMDYPTQSLSATGAYKSLKDMGGEVGDGLAL